METVVCTETGGNWPSLTRLALGARVQGWDRSISIGPTELQQRPQRVATLAHSTNRNTTRHNPGLASLVMARRRGIRRETEASAGGVGVGGVGVGGVRGDIKAGVRGGCRDFVVASAVDGVGSGVGSVGGVVVASVGDGVGGE